MQDDIKLRWSIEPAAVSKPANGKINCQGLKLSESVTLYQLAGIPCGVEKTSLSLLSRKVPLKGPMGHIVSYDLKGSTKTLIPVYPDTAIHVGEVPADVISRIEAAAQISAIFNNSRLHFDKETQYARSMLYDNSVKMAELSLKEGIVSPVASLYAKPGLTKDGTLNSFGFENAFYFS